MSNIGIPYMGSKRKIAPEILKTITQRHPYMTDFYDLFGGGGSVSFSAITNYRFNVHYNELNSHIYSLVKYLVSNKELDPKFFDWVSREDFLKHSKRLNDDADWYSGFVMTCWSFGNNSDKGYLYGNDIEEIKRLGHEVVVNLCRNSMKKLKIDIPQLFEIKDLHKRRIIFCKYIEKETKERFDIQNLERLSMIESLSRLQNLQNLQNLKVSNLSYENVIITGQQPVLYCDIPYKGTEEYKDGGFDHDKFYNWASATDHAVYVSEYNSPFEMVEMFRHRSSLSATNNKKKTVECVFWNGKGDFHNNKLF